MSKNKYINIGVDIDLGKPEDALVINETKRYCIFCGSEFNATRAWHKYCHRNCREKAVRRTQGLISQVGRHCKQCGKHFIPATVGAQHCSDECSTKSAQQSRSRFFKNNPDILKKYHRKTFEKIGHRSNLDRLYVRFPELPKECQSCGESRVLDVAHKPDFKRNGQWRSVANCTPDKIWILCPTCHALIDRKGYDPKTLGLI